MPKSELHKKKRMKNYAVLVLIVIFIAIIWAVTLVKMANAAEPDLLDVTAGPTSLIPQESSSGTAEMNDDLPQTDVTNTTSDRKEGGFIDTRTVHADAMQSAAQSYADRGQEHLDKLLDRQKQWDETYQPLEW